MQSLLDESVRSRVSSVLSRQTTEFGKQHLFDRNPETSWASDSGKPQWIVLDFPEPVCLHQVSILFQGGFVGKDCFFEALEATQTDNKFTKWCSFYPEEKNVPQTFTITPEEKQKVPVKRLKILFNESTDFYGRIIVYDLDILGNKAN